MMAGEIRRFLRSASGGLFALVALLGCQGDRQGTSSDLDPSEPTPDSSGPLAVSANSSPLDIALQHAPVALPAASHEYAHGVWSSCMNGFRTSNQPQRDVTRLSYVCGPYQGMSKLGRTWFGRVNENLGGSFDVELREHQCGRVFAVASSKLPSFVVSVIGPSGLLVARGQGSESFAVANAEGAFCVNESGTFRVTVTAQRGMGLVATEVWTLPPP